VFTHYMTTSSFLSNKKHSEILLSSLTLKRLYACFVCAINTEAFHILIWKKIQNHILFF
jgi:hypothetical protein